MRLALVLVAGILAACATQAPSDTLAAAEGQQFCKRMTSVSSNVPQRVCHTKEEWAAIDKQGQANVDDFERARDEVNSPGQ